MSHPVWVRGLKQCSLVIEALNTLSHPVWVRGLKQQGELTKAQAEVAPRVGAWIETLTDKYPLLESLSRTPCGCVD